MSGPRAGGHGARGSADHRTELRGAAAGVVAGLGAFFAVGHLSSVEGGLAPATLQHVPLFVLSVAMLYTGYWLLTCDATHRRVGSVALWSVAGFLVLVAVGLWAAGGRGGLPAAVGVAVDVGTVGASSGLLVGLEGERRRRKLDRRTHRAVGRADERFAFFNRLLRHHVLNGVAVVRGHAELLAEVPGDAAEAAGVIRRRCDEMADLVRRVDTLSRTYTGDLPVGPTDPTPALQAAVRAAREDGIDVDVAGDGGGRQVLANDRVDLVFEAVLEAAGAAATDDRVAVETTHDGEEFVATARFDGDLRVDPGGAVEPGEYGDEDLELFLAESLLKYVGGALVLAAEGEESTIEVRLRLAG